MKKYLYKSLFLVNLQVCNLQLNERINSCSRNFPYLLKLFRRPVFLNTSQSLLLIVVDGNTCQHSLNTKVFWPVINAILRMLLWTRHYQAFYQHPWVLAFCYASLKLLLVCFFDTEVAAGFAVGTFPSSLIISVVCVVGGVAEDELRFRCHVAWWSDNKTPSIGSWFVMNFIW